MPYLIDIPTIHDERGNLSVLDNLLPFEIKRVFYIYNVSGLRGGHSHKATRQALISLKDECIIHIKNTTEEKDIILSSPNQCLILEPEDWHTMEFSKTAILLVLSSEHYNKDDYIYEEPK